MPTSLVIKRPELERVRKSTGSAITQAKRCRAPRRRERRRRGAWHELNARAQICCDCKNVHPEVKGLRGMQKNRHEVYDFLYVHVDPQISSSPLLPGFPVSTYISRVFLCLCVDFSSPRLESFSKVRVVLRSALRPLRGGGRRSPERKLAASCRTPVHDSPVSHQN